VTQLAATPKRSLTARLRKHGRALVAAVPLGWLLLFFLVPFAIVLKISVAEAILAMPPYTPLIQWVDGQFLQLKLDIENYLFLFFGPNSKARFQGENTSNYDNPEYDQRYRRLQLLDDGPAKQKVIDEMVDLLREDAPWSFGYFPYAGGAYQQWVGNAKYGVFTNDRALYYKVDAPLRVRKQAEWNPPRYWPLALLVCTPTNRRPGANLNNAIA